VDRITESLLTDFSTEYELSSLDEDKRFEHFASFITVRRSLSDTFDTEDIVTGSGSDTGIDAIAIIANGTLVTDVEGFIEQADRSGSLDITFILVQAERSPSFETAKIGQFQFGVLDFFKDKPALPRNSMVQSRADIMDAIYKRSAKFKRGNPICRLFYVTTGRWQNDPNLEVRRAAAVADIEVTNLFRDVEFQCIGADVIQKLYNQTKNALSREFAFTDRAVVPEIKGVNEAYLGFVSAQVFLSIVSDDNDEIIKSIFYDNVRDWQDYNEVNTEIKATLESTDKARFILMNNGVTVIARTVRPTGNKFYIEDFQVVNGCQTSHVLADCRDQIDGSVMIPLRLIGTQDEDVISAIVHATNRQTEVKNEQFFAVTDFAKKLELFFQSFPNGKRLYYERRSHQYDSLAIEKTRIVAPGNLIRSFAAMYLGEPHATTRNYSRLTDRIGEQIFVAGHKIDP
jgi:AIPR protein